MEAPVFAGAEGHDSHRQQTLSDADHVKTGKLVFGSVRAGQTQLASHRSHSSHSAHYSGSGGGYYPAPAATPPAPTPLAPSPSYPYSPPSQVTPTPEPRVQAPTPAPSSAILADVLKKLPKVRSKWPKEAKLTKNTTFNLYDGGHLIGLIQINAGTKVRVIEIKLEHAVVEISTGQSPLPVINTDIVERMGGAAVILALPDDAPPQSEQVEEPSARSGTA